MPNANTKIVAGVMVTFCLILLIGQRLGATWAGGQGQVEACLATNEANGQTFKRGDSLAATDSFASFRLCDGTRLYLDKNTEVTLAAYPVEFEPNILTLIQGRVIVDGVANISARNTHFEVMGGACEFVHYSWRDELDVTPLAADSCKLIDSKALPVFEQTTRYNTFTTSQIQTQPFQPQAGAAHEFYVWTGLAFASPTQD